MGKPIAAFLKLCIADFYATARHYKGGAVWVFDRILAWIHKLPSLELS
jgi:hypothetical protein